MGCIRYTHVHTHLRMFGRTSCCSMSVMKTAHCWAIISCQGNVGWEGEEGEEGWGERGRGRVGGEVWSVKEGEIQGQ